MRGAEEELEAQRGELGEFRRKVEGERKNYKRLLKAQEAKMREQEKARAVSIPQPLHSPLARPRLWLLLLTFGMSCRCNVRGRCWRSGSGTCTTRCATRRWRSTR